MRILQLFGALTVVLIIAPSVAYAGRPLPKPDFSDVPGYIRALQASRNPQAQAIVKEIADGPKALATERTAARAEDIPLELTVLTKPPDDENAAALYDRWRKAKRLQELPFYASMTMSANYAYTADQLTAVRRAIDANRSVYALLHRATETEQYIPDQEWKTKTPPMEDFTTLAQYREAARQLSTESVLLAKEGHLAEAVDNGTRCFRLARQLASGGTLIDYLVALAIDGIGMSTMKGVLNIAGPNAEIDDRIRAALAEHAGALSLRTALSGEVGQSLALMDSSRGLSPAKLAETLANYSGLDYTPKPGAPREFSEAERQFIDHLIDAAEARYIHQMRQSIAVADYPSPVRTKVFATVKTSFTVTDSKPPLDPIELLVSMMSPSVLTGMGENDLVRRADKVVLQMAAAVLAAKSRTGAFPETLPMAFTDPFTGGPLGYRHEGKSGFVVYSAGPDRTFDGGTAGHKLKKYETLFRYPPPPLKPLPAAMLEYPDKAKKAKLPKGLAAYNGGPTPALLFDTAIDVGGLTVSPDGRWLAGMCYPATGPSAVRLWDAATGALARVVDEGYQHSEIAFSPDSKVLVCGDRFGVVRLWDPGAGDMRREIDTGGGSLESLSFSADSSELATTASDGVMRFWDTAAGALVRTVKTGDNVYVSSAMVSPDGTLIAMTGRFNDGDLRITNARTGETIRTLNAGSEIVNAVAISPDGKFVAAASWDKAVKAWRVDTGEKIADITERENVWGLAFSPDGARLAMSSNHIRIRDLNAKRKDLILAGEGAGLAFYPDGKHFAASGIAGGVAVWELP